MTKIPALTRRTKFFQETFRRSVGADFFEKPIEQRETIAIAQ